MENKCTFSYYLHKLAAIVERNALKHAKKKYKAKVI